MQNGNPNFIETGKIVTFPGEHRAGFNCQYRTTGRPEQQGTAQDWDGVPAEFNETISSRIEGVVLYCRIEVTGSKIRRFNSDLWGVAALIHLPEGDRIKAVIPYTEERVKNFQWG